jgi:hypothetical protein
MHAASLGRSRTPRQTGSVQRLPLQAPVPIDVRLADHVRDRDVIPHALETYDEKPRRRG